MELLARGRSTQAWEELQAALAVVLLVLEALQVASMAQLQLAVRDLGLLACRRCRPQPLRRLPVRRQRATMVLGPNDPTAQLQGPAALQQLQRLQGARAGCCRRHLLVDLLSLQPQATLLLRLRRLVTLLLSHHQHTEHRQPQRLEGCYGLQRRQAAACCLRLPVLPALQLLRQVQHQQRQLLRPGSSCISTLPQAATTPSQRLQQRLRRQQRLPCTAPRRRHTATMRHRQQQLQRRRLHPRTGTITATTHTPPIQRHPSTATARPLQAMRTRILLRRRATRRHRRQAATMVRRRRRTTEQVLHQAGQLPSVAGSTGRTISGQGMAARRRQRTTLSPPSTAAAATRTDAESMRMIGSSISVAATESLRSRVLVKQRGGGRCSV